MKNILFLLVMFASFVACSKDDDEDVKINTEQVIGRWDVTWAQQDGKSLDIPVGNVYMNLKADGTYKTVMFDDYYIGEWELDGNKVIGTTKDPITEHYIFTSLNGNNAEIDYSNSEGLKMKFKATKDNVDYTPILGTWADVSYTEGDYISSKLELSWTFREDKTATQRLVMYMNGVNMKDVSLDFTYVYNGKEIVTKNSSGKESVHEVYVNGNKMRLGDSEGGYFDLTKK